MAGESKLQKKVIPYLESLGAYAVKVVVANKAGTHDILFCLKSRFYSLELKSGKNKPSALQLAKRDQVREAGGVVMIIWSMEELKTAMKEHESKDKPSKRLVRDVPLL